MASEKELEAKMDMTPMIDVVFLLLIFFLVGTKFKREEGRFRAFLPKNRGQGSGKAEIELNDVRVKLLWVDVETGRPTDDKDPRNGKVILKVGNNDYESVMIDDERLGFSYEIPDYEYFFQRLLEFKENHRPSDPSKTLPVIIDARASVPYKHIVWVLNACVRAGLSDVTFAAAGLPID